MHWRRWRRFSFHKKKNGQAYFAIMLGVLLALLMIHTIHNALRPPLVALTESRIRNQIIHMAEEAVGEVLYRQGASYSDMVSLQTGKSGEITTLSTDTVQLNQLRNAVMEQVITQVEDLDTEELGIPLGLLTGWDLLSATGPKLPVRVLSVASASGSYRNDFISAGINQTLHRIFLDVTILVRVLLPGGIVETEVMVPISVAETVIIGQVPQTYLNLNQ